MLLATSARAGAAADEPIVLAGGDEAFRAALADALVPAGMTVVTVPDPPSPTIGDVAAQSRILADHDGATATVWLVGAGDTTTLVTYDRDVDRVLVRTLPYTLPLSPTQAAEAARMARTMLRALRVTPDLDLAPPHVAEAIEVRQRAAMIAPPPPPAIAAEPPLLAIELLGGVRVGGPAGDAGGFGSTGILWRPDGLGVAFTGALAPRGDIRSSTFMGSIRDDSVAATARWSLPIADRLAVAASAGAALHFVSLDGTLATGDAAASSRIDPAARAGLESTYEVGRLGIALGVTADWLVRRQAYEVDATPVLQIRRFQLSAGLGLTARFP